MSWRNIIFAGAILFMFIVIQDHNHAVKDTNKQTVVILQEELPYLEYLYHAGIEKILPDSLKEEYKGLSYELKFMSSGDDRYDSKYSIKRRRIEKIESDAEKHCPACIWVKEEINRKKQEIKELQQK